MSDWDKWGLVFTTIAKKSCSMVIFDFLWPSRDGPNYWYSVLRGWFRYRIWYAWLLRYLLGWVSVWLASNLLALDLIWWRVCIFMIFKRGLIFFNMKFLWCDFLLLGETLLIILINWSLISEALALCRFHEVWSPRLCRHCWALKGILSNFRS